jgi:hypothetical protein
MTETPNAHTYTRAAWLLLAGCALIAVAAEGAARFALDRVSKIQRRTADEYRLARTIGADECGRKHVLLVGNSRSTLRHRADLLLRLVLRIETAVP